ncbi:hypothetical protein A1F94_002115 [Pyrenophora tritici-repentis]|nr:hypothetical protein A1F94_006920 [Pyrenophora tritici-repentis]KAG9389222.1 hypothetical protein A1F94_002115 [Pyrenophora tritici-repentis]
MDVLDEYTRTLQTLAIDFGHRDALTVIRKTVIAGYGRKEAVSTNLKGKAKMFFRPGDGHP